MTEPISNLDIVSKLEI